MSFPDLIGESSKTFLDCPIKLDNDKMREFINLVNELLFNQSEREKLSESAKKIMPQDAAGRMAEIIMDMAKQSPPLDIFN